MGYDFALRVAEHRPTPISAAQAYAIRSEATCGSVSGCRAQAYAMLHEATGGAALGKVLCGNRRSVGYDFALRAVEHRPTPISAKQPVALGWETCPGAFGIFGGKCQGLCHARGSRWLTPVPWSGDLAQLRPMP